MHLKIKNINDKNEKDGDVNLKRGECDLPVRMG